MDAEPEHQPEFQPTWVIKGRQMPPNVLMLFPRFEPHSFWNLQAVCDVVGARCPAPPLGLITLAALLPSNWNIRLINRNAEELTAGDIEWADLVMTGGMRPQQPDTLVLIDLCHAQGKPVVVGGPDATSSPEEYRSADYLVLGEAEGIIDRFVEAWSAGVKRGVFEAEKFQVDVTRSPIPRFDLLKFDHYLYIGVQFSRGCPFNCEFCDIIELYGRVPRAKTNEQMLKELDALYGMGYRGHVDFVDDNLIGNKKALKRFLPFLRNWQRQRGYPFRFSTEASVNLADDGQLLQMLREANFFAVFMGIESPDTDTLVAMQKKQNTRRILAESVHKVYAAGMYVIAGFIIGFDSEKKSVSRGMIDSIEAMSIPVCMVGLLSALPNTQLTRRLIREGRYRPRPDIKGDQCTGGLEFITLRPRRDILADYKVVLESIYNPNAYFGRVRHIGCNLDVPPHAVRTMFKELRRAIGSSVRLAWRMTVRQPELRRYYWRTVFDCLRSRPRNLYAVSTLMAFYLHVGAFAQYLVGELDGEIALLDDAQCEPLPSELTVAQPRPDTVVTNVAL
jgi:radical SAM superfamily enzyme YgiQ (UPF0313 family)